MIDRQRFPNTPSSVTKARHFAERSLDGYPEPIIESASLIVSELATNCIQHAHSGFEMDVEIEGNRVRVAVTDDGVGEPEMRTPSPIETSGRGLQIVELLAKEWGVIPSTPHRGKTVWFRLCVENRTLQNVQCS